MKKYCIILLLNCFFCSALTAQTQKDSSAASLSKGMIVTPAALAFNLNNGQAATKTLRITNGLPDRKQYKVFLGDWERDSTGGHKYYPANTLPQSCARWIKVDKEIFELDPDSSTSITISLQIPDSIEAVKEMKWAMVFIQLVNESKPVKTEKDIVQQLIYNFRMGVHIYQTAPDLKRVYLNMTSFKPISEKKDSIVYQMTCVNEGTQQLRVKATFEITNLTTGIKIKHSPKDFPMFPNQRRVVNFELPKDLPPGKYSILATADGGDVMPLQAAQVEIDIK